MVATPLQHVALGETGLAVAKLSLGTVKLGRDQGVKYPTPVKIPTDKEASELLKAARQLGINMLDTAPAYGRSEQRLGALLAATRSSRWFETGLISPPKRPLLLCFHQQDAVRPSGRPAHRYVT